MYLSSSSHGGKEASLIPTDAHIGLCLSGGGIRAAIFHLGVLQWLAELSLLENLRHLSTVSGASLAVALIYARSGGRFPHSSAYLEKTLPKIRETILGHDIQDRALMSLTVRPWNWRRKTNLVAEAMEQLWDIRGSVRDLPPDPLWSINCTTFETGKDFRISQLEMGDYKIGYTQAPAISIAEAAAASAGFPVLIGPYRLNTKNLCFARRSLPSAGSQPTGPESCSSSECGSGFSGRALHLWDGGVYDNLGLEALYKIADSGHLTGKLSHLIISNASTPNGYVKRDFFSPVSNLRRLLDITMSQVNALRSRDVSDYLYRTGNGCYLRIGELPLSPGKNPWGGGVQSPRWLTPEQVAYVKDYPTTLSSPSPEDFDLLLRHGYEVARKRIFTPQIAPY